MATTSRAVTNKILELMDEGVFDPQVIAECCLRYMSEDEVADMAQAEGLIEPEEDEYIADE